jgi:hypothetical protein
VRHALRVRPLGRPEPTLSSSRDPVCVACSGLICWRLLLDFRPAGRILRRRGHARIGFLGCIPVFPLIRRSIPVFLGCLHLRRDTRIGRFLVVRHGTHLAINLVSRPLTALCSVRRSCVSPVTTGDPLGCAHPSWRVSPHAGAKPVPTELLRADLAAGNWIIAESLRCTAAVLNRCDARVSSNVTVTYAAVSVTQAVRGSKADDVRWGSWVFRFISCRIVLYVP